VSIKVSTFMRMHDVDCDRCGAPMRAIAARAGVDPHGNIPAVWTDRERRETPRRRASDTTDDEIAPPKIA
jgi:hypothetical protein